MIEIDEKNLMDLLERKKEHIGGSWIGGIINFGSAVSFGITLFTANISIQWLKTVLIIVLVINIGAAFLSLIKCLTYNYNKLSNDILSLDRSKNKYSLVAIMNDFEGDSANKVLLQYYSNDWDTYMFFSFPTAREDDENNIISRVAASLKIDRKHLKVRFLEENPNQPKYSPNHKEIREYHNKYYQVFIANFPDSIKESSFEIDGCKYKWMTLEEMKSDDNIKNNNKDVLQVFEKYIFNTSAKLELKDNATKIPDNICLRLNRKCNLSCSFCLAEKETDELSFEQISFILSTLKLKGIKKARLAGGEPTLRSDFMDIVKLCINLNLETLIYTNLVDVDEAIIEELSKLPVSIITSIHGDESFHDSITKKGAYRKTYQNINKLKSYGVPVSIHTVIMNRNFNLAEDVVNDAINAGINKISFQTLIPREKGSELFAQGENSTEIQKKLQSLEYLKEKYKSKITIHLINLYEKNYYVLETDGIVYLQKSESILDKPIINLLASS